MKTVYTIDKDRILSGTRIADMDGMEPGRMVLMLNEIEAEPLPAKEGHAVRHNEEAGKWEYVVDHRGSIVFDPVTGDEITIDVVGPIDDYATAPKPTKYHTWDEKKQTWTITKADQAILDAEQEAQKADQATADVASLRAQCDRDILPLQDAVDLDEATPEEAARLKALKRFRIALNRWLYPEVIPSKP